MKKINANNIIRAVVLGVFVIGASLFLGNKVNASYPVIFGQTQQDRENRFLTNAGNIFNGSLGGIALPVLELAPKSDSNSINISNSDLVESTGFLGSTSINYALRQYGTAIFDNIAVYQNAVIDNVFSGFQSIAGSANSDARLQVNGQIQIESLADPLAVGQRRLCTNDAGILSLCDNLIEPTEPTLVYNWNTVWGACSDSTPSTGSCSGRYSSQPYKMYAFDNDIAREFDWVPGAIYYHDETSSSDAFVDPIPLFLDDDFEGNYVGDQCVVGRTYYSVLEDGFSGHIYDFGIGESNDTLSYIGSDQIDQYYWYEMTAVDVPLNSVTGNYDYIRDYGCHIGVPRSEVSDDSYLVGQKSPSPAWLTIKSCSGETESQCLQNNNVSTDSCSWNNTGSGQSGSTQSGTTTCRDQNGNIVSDNLCTEPRPATSRAC